MESWKAEMYATSDSTYFMVAFDGICDVKFTGGRMISRFGDFQYPAERLPP
jgi:hypothetical protein